MSETERWAGDGDYDSAWLVKERKGKNGQWYKRGEFSVFDAADRLNALEADLATAKQEIETLRANVDYFAEGVPCSDCGRQYRLSINILDGRWEEIARREETLCAWCIIQRLESLALVAASDGNPSLQPFNAQLLLYGVPLLNELAAEADRDRWKGLAEDTRTNHWPRHNHDEGDPSRPYANCPACQWDVHYDVLKAEEKA